MKSKANSRTGRPRILNDARCAEICNLAATGLTMAAIARQVGCSVKTIERQLVRDNIFSFRVRMARSSLRSQALNVIRRAAKTNPAAAAWLAAHPQNSIDAKRDRPTT